MRRHLSQYLTVLSATASLMVTSSANGDTPVDPNAYHCWEEFSNSELGWFRSTLFANKKLGVQYLESEWRSGSKAPRIRGFWRHRNYKPGNRDFGLGIFTVSYSGISSENKIRIQIGNCYGNQNVCGGEADYATDYRHSDGGAYARANWGAVAAIGRTTGNLYIQVQDEAGAVLREEKLPVTTLSSVEKEIGVLMDAVSEKEARLKDQCMARKPLNTPPR